MKPCPRIGVDITWKCNWQCRHCFYLRNPNFHSGKEVPFAKIYGEIKTAADNGMDHVVMIGYGEPTQSDNFFPVIEAANEFGMASSVITNGTAPLTIYDRAFEMGLDHLHISSHGPGEILDKVACKPGAWEIQRVLKDWLQSRRLPYRVNISMQQVNYEHLLESAKQEVEFGAWHFIMLGFLPHYEWNRHVNTVAVHPAELRPHIEEAAEYLLSQGTYLTIRYHPFCHLAPELWKYVVNARYVYFDPWEWNYTLRVDNPTWLWEQAKALGDSVACKSPCDECLMRNHCGGWNRTYANAFDGAGLTPIKSIPAEYENVWQLDGGLHDMNPVNWLSGTIEKEI